jgi:Spy/CpxP family protein refolding chaperone
MYGLVMQEMMDQSRQAMDSLTPEQKAELERRFKGGA